MIVNFKIEQHVKSVRKGWREIVFSTSIKRLAMVEFNTLKSEYPDEYFELIKVERQETCIAFTPFK